MCTLAHVYRCVSVRKRERTEQEKRDRHTDRQTDRYTTRGSYYTLLGVNQNKKWRDAYMFMCLIMKIESIIRLIYWWFELR